MALFKKRFLTPGPTPIPERVRAVMQTVHGVHHRSELFSNYLKRCRSGLQAICQSECSPILLNASGTGGLDAAIFSWLLPSESVAILNGGKFGERLVEIATARGLNVHEYRWNPENKTFDSVHLMEWLSSLKESPPKAFLMQANETSTGVFYPMAEISAGLRKSFPNLLFFVDGISALIAHSLSCKNLGIDVLVGASQKGFGVPTGMSFVAMSDRARQALEKTSHAPDRGVYYFDLHREWSLQEKKATTAWTYSFELLVGMCESLSIIEETGGLFAMNAHHADLARRVRRGLLGLGFKCFVCDSLASNALTSFGHASLDLENVSKVLVDEYQIVVAGGQDELKGRILRLSHLGFVDRNDMLVVIAALGQIALKAGVLDKNKMASALASFLDDE